MTAEVAASPGIQATGRPGVPRVLVTGANGFVGRHLIRRLIAEETAVRAIVRTRSRPAVDVPAGRGDVVAVGDIESRVDWRRHLEGVDVVVHLAGRAHVRKRFDAADAAAFRETNCDATLRLAEQATSSGVGRFVFMSSVAVNGRRTNGRPFTAASPPNPLSAYAVSKWQAEKGLWDIARGSSMGVVVVRPPLVYGPGAPGNWARLVSAVRRQLPLPLKRVENRRSFIGVDNLCDFLWQSTRHPAAPGHTFLVADGEDISTPGLVRQLAMAIGTTPRLFPVSPSVLVFAARLAGNAAWSDALLASLEIDVTETRERLDWNPPLSLHEGIRRAVSEAAEAG